MASPPKISQPVHYVSYGTPDGEYDSTCRAAFVTQIIEPESGTVGVAVLNPTGLFFHPAIVLDGGKAPGTWHYPCSMTD